MVTDTEHFILKIKNKLKLEVNFQIKINKTIIIKEKNWEYWLIGKM